MTLETYIRAQLARIAIEEAARHGGTNHMSAVMMVLRNRVFAGWGTWLDVVERAQLKRANENVPAQDASMILRSGTGRIVLSRVDEIYSRTDIEDLTAGALFWVDMQLPITAWFKKEVIDRPDDHPRVAQNFPVWYYQ